MNARMIDELFGAGLLQFGRFRTARGIALFQHHLAWLPSYPDLMRNLTMLIAPLLPGDCERLVCPIDSLATTTALSMQTGIPLVYRAGQYETLTQDFIGAYDVGHPTALILHDVPDSDWLEEQVRDAARVGLHVNTLITVIETARPAVELHYRPLLSLREIVDYLAASALMTPEQAEAIRAAEGF